MPGFVAVGMNQGLLEMGLKAMDIHVSVPSVKRPPGYAEIHHLELLLKRMCVAELYRIRAMDADEAAYACGMGVQDFQRVFDELHIPASIFQEPVDASFFNRSSASRSRIMTGFLSFALTAVALVSAASVFYYVKIRPAAILASATVAMGRGDYSEAEKFYAERLKLEKGNFDAVYGIARIHLLKADSLGEKGKRAEAMKELKASIPYLDSAAKLRPMNASVIFDRAFTAEKLGDEAAALELYRNVLSIDPEYSLAKMHVRDIEKRHTVEAEPYHPWWDDVNIK